jgi:predicted translin family RNA/ssDNA-binding protein
MGLATSEYRGKHCWVMPMGSPPTCALCGLQPQNGSLPFGPCPGRQLTDAETRIEGLHELYAHFERLLTMGVAVSGSYEYVQGMRLCEALWEQSETVETLQDEIRHLKDKLARFEAAA